MKSYPSSADHDVQLVVSIRTGSASVRLRRTAQHHRYRFVPFMISLPVFIVISWSTDFQLGSTIGNRLQEFGTGILYNLQRHANSKTAIDLFLSQNPIFTQVLSMPALEKVLAERRRFRGGVFENTLVAACSDDSSVLPSTLESWNRVRGVREVVIVDYNTPAENRRSLLEIVDSFDRLGRIVYVTAVSPGINGNVSGRWPKGKAFNLGVAVASGRNVMLVDCHTKVSPFIIWEHRLNSRTYFVGASSSGSGTTRHEYDALLVSKKNFDAVKGFDERMDISGDEYRGLASSLTLSLHLRRLSIDSDMIQRLGGNTETTTGLRVDEGIFATEDIVLRARKIPALARYMAYFARKELPAWNGSIFNHSTSTEATQGLQFSVLREQLESLRHSQAATPVFMVSRKSDYRLWIHATATSRPISMLDMLSRKSVYALMTTAHRHLLHDDYNVPFSLLTYIEGFPGKNPVCSNFSNRGLWYYHCGKEGGVSNYSPVLYDIVWHRKKFLVANLQADDAMELFVAFSWAIASSVANNRALVVTGQLAGTPVGEMFDFDAMNDALHREYNLRTNIMGGREEWVCSNGGGSRCWNTDDAFQNWDEVELMEEPSTVRLNASQHVLCNIVTANIRRWEQGEAGTLYQARILKQAFASISLSRDLGYRLLSVNETIVDNLAEATTLWVTASVKRGSMKRARGFVTRYLEHNSSQESRRSIIFVTGKSIEAIANITRGVAAAQTTAGPFDAYRRVVDLWIALQCRNIVFDSIALPGAWTGAESLMLEWRKIHATEALHFGVSHLLPSSRTSQSLVGFHELEFDPKPSTGH